MVSLEVNPESPLTVTVRPLWSHSELFKVSGAAGGQHYHKVALQIWPAEAHFNRGNLNCYTKRMLQDSAISFFHFRDGGIWASLRKSQGFLQMSASCRVKTWSKNSRFLSEDLVQVFLFFLFCFSFSKIFSFSRENEITKNIWRKKRHKLPFSWVKTWSNYVARHTWTKFWLNLGPSVDSTFLTFFGLFSFFFFVKLCWNHFL